MSAHHHGSARSTALIDGDRIALVGSPNSGKTTLFNSLTGLRAKTGNYPGVTVARHEGRCQLDGTQVVIEDLPGSYSLDPIGPDEQVLVDVLDPLDSQVQTPDAVLGTLDATTLPLSLRLLAQVLQTGLPACVVLTFTDELTRRQGAVDTAALCTALGVPVDAVTAGRRHDMTGLRSLLAEHETWARPTVLPPSIPAEVSSWITLVLAAARYRLPEIDDRTRRVDAVLLHPLWGSLVFFATMFVFFQVIFTLAAPLQDGIERFYA